MKILAVNAGSSSFKFKLLELPERKELASGLFEKLELMVLFIQLNIMEKK